MASFNLDIILFSAGQMIFTETIEVGDPDLSEETIQEVTSNQKVRS